MFRLLICISVIFFICNISRASDTDYYMEVSQQKVFTKIIILKKNIGIVHAKVIAKYMADSINKNKLPPNAIISIGFIESGFKQGARGSQSDMGIMQVMPFWKKEELCKDVARLWHAKDNIECGCRVLRYYIDMFGGDILKGLVAYNMGPTNVRELLKRKVRLNAVWYARKILDVKGFLDDYDEAITRFELIKIFPGYFE